MNTRNKEVRKRIFYAFVMVLIFSLVFTGIAVYVVMNIFLIDELMDLSAHSQDISSRVRMVLFIPFSIMLGLSMTVAYFLSTYVTKNLTKLQDEKVKATGELKGVVLSTMAELIEERDDVTGHHIERTTEYLKVLIDSMKVHGIYADELSHYDEALLLQSCQLHDIGKISIRDDILLKPEKFTNDEYELIKNHTVFGEQVIDRIRSGTLDNNFLEYAKIFAATHHERWDGGGYPKGLKGDDIPLLGRMMAIVDVYDALVSPRQYKKAYAANEATQIIKDGRGTHFDPVLTDLFVMISGKFEQISIELSEGGQAELLLQKK